MDWQTAALLDAGQQALQDMALLIAWLEGRGLAVERFDDGYHVLGLAPVKASLGPFATTGEALVAALERLMERNTSCH